MIQTYATASRVHNAHVEYLGRDINYNSNDGRLHILLDRPHPDGPHYDPRTGAVSITPSDVAPLAQDPDLIAHEQAHAIMDSQRPDYDRVQPRTLGAAQEGQADATSMLTALRNPDVRADAIAAWNRGERHNLASEMAEGTNAHFDAQRRAMGSRFPMPFPFPRPDGQGPPTPAPPDDKRTPPPKGEIRPAPPDGKPTPAPKEGSKPAPPDGKPKPTPKGETGPTTPDGKPTPPPKHEHKPGQPTPAPTETKPPDPREGLRDAADPPPTMPDTQIGTPHEASRKFSSAVYDSVQDIYNRVRKEDPKLSEDEALQRATRIVSSDLARSNDFLPVGTGTNQTELAQAMIKADRIGHEGQYREIYERNFREAGLQTRSFQNRAQELPTAQLAGEPKLQRPAELAPGQARDFRRPQVRPGQPAPAWKAPPQVARAEQYLEQNREALGLPQDVDYNAQWMYHNDRGETFIHYSNGLGPGDPSAEHYAMVAFDKSGKPIHFDARDVERPVVRPMGGPLGGPFPWPIPGPVPGPFPRLPIPQPPIPGPPPRNGNGSIG